MGTIPDTRRTISAQSSSTRARKSGFFRRRYTVRNRPRAFVRLYAWPNLPAVSGAHGTSRRDSRKLNGSKRIERCLFFQDRQTFLQVSDLPDFKAYLQNRPCRPQPYGRRNSSLLQL